MVGDRLNEAEISNAVFDLDGLPRMWPSPPGGPRNTAVTLRNLASVAGIYLDFGTQRLVLAVVVQTAGQQEAFSARRLPCPWWCRLLVDLPVSHARLAHRHENTQTALGWHLNRSGELDAIWMPHE